MLGLKEGKYVDPLGNHWLLEKEKQFYTLQWYKDKKIVFLKSDVSFLKQFLKLLTFLGE